MMRLNIIELLDIDGIYYWQIFGLKILVNWLRGKVNNESGSVQPVFAMLDKAIKQNGDITGGGCIR